MTDARTHRGGRKPTGTLIRSPRTRLYSAKIWVPCPDCKGAACLACKPETRGRVRVTKPLGTDDTRAAKARLAQLLAAENPNAFDATAPETFADAAKRIIEQQRDEDGVSTWKERQARVTTYCKAIADLPVTRVTEGMLDEALRDAAETLSGQSVVHLRNDLGGIFKELWRKRAIPENPMLRVRLPKALRGKDDRPRVHLTDDEFLAFVESPVVPQRLRVFAIAIRYVGGMRTSDAHAWDWSHIDLKGFRTAKVYRPKTDKRPGAAPVVVSTLQGLIIPDEARAPLKAWWTQAKKPTKGPVFPVAVGERAGERQGKRSHVRELRHYLWAAGVRRATTKDACPLQSDTAATRATDVHSLRRAYATGLAAAGVPIRQAMALAGHKDARTHGKYVDLAQRGALQAPQAAFPQKSKPRTFASRRIIVSIGDPSENRTRVTGVRGRCPNR